MLRLLIAIVVLAGSSPVAAATGIEGNWITQDKSALIAVGRCGDRICGRIAKLLIIRPGYPLTDVNNPSPNLRSRSLLGLSILTGFVAERTQWSQGRIYDPTSGKTYRSKLKLNDDGSLKVSGCVAFFCQSQRWTRAR